MKKARRDIMRDLHTVFSITNQKGGVGNEKKVIMKS